MKIRLITHRCFSCFLLVLTLIKDLSVSQALPAGRCTRKWEGAWPGELTPTGHRVYPYHRLSCPVYKLWGRLDGGLVWLEIKKLVVRNNRNYYYYFIYLFFNFNFLLLGALLVSGFFCFFLFCFVCLIKFSSSQTTSFLTFTLLILSPTLLGFVSV